MTSKKLFEPLSNYDLINAVSKDLHMRCNIVDVGDLDGNEDLDKDIFKGRGHCILFEMPDPNADIGHWTALIRNKDSANCIYFDSYGDKLPSPELRRILGRNYDQIQYNPNKYQSCKSSVCGRYALAIVALNKMYKDLNIMDIKKFFDAKPSGISYDQYILNMTKDIKTGM